MWIDKAAGYLRDTYFLTLEDIGVSPLEFEVRWRDQGETVEDAIDAFAQKYDIHPVFVWPSIGGSAK